MAQCTSRNGLRLEELRAFMLRSMLPPAAKTFALRQNGQMPNNPALPARCFPAALTGSAGQVRAHLHKRHWTGAWTGLIYNFHHYHSHAHEVLVVLRGRAEVILGGEGGPTLTVAEGDVLLLPAGVGHCCPHHSPDFLVMGAYAAGRNWDICRPEETDLHWALKRIAEVPHWEAEPV